jgi:hypothetical protein
MVGAWLVETLGFGVVLQHALYASFAKSETADPAVVESMRAGLLPEGIADFAAGALPFWGAAMSLAIGALAVGGEYRSGTVRLLYTAGPSRGVVLAAQLAALAGVLGVMALLTLLVDWAGLVAAAGLAGWPVVAPPLGATAVSLLCLWLTALTYGLVGAGLAVLTRSAMTALGAGLIWTLGAETVLILVAGAVPWLKVPAHALLGAATSDLAVARGSYPWWPNRFSETVDAAGGWPAADVLAAWAALAVAVALWAVGRRDMEA